MPVNELWRIQGVLTARSPLHVGDGLARDPEEVEIASICRDGTGRPYLPGSSLRGFLREAFERRFPESVASMFGQNERQGGASASARGGLLSVWDALIAENVQPSVASHVVLDRQTRTADDGLLYFEEYLPAGTAFSVNLVVECAMHGDGEDVERLVRELLGMLRELRNDPGRLGSNAASGYGHVEWSLGKVTKLTPKALQGWLGSGRQLIDCLESVSISPESTKYDVTGRYLPIPVKLHFSGPFLVNGAAKKKKGDDGANHVAIRTPDGRCRLPGPSIHGALRSQTERIARTIAGSDENARKWVRDVGTATGVPEAYTAVDCLWGGVGLRSPVRVTDFEAKQADRTALQDFVAIDRFTGGGADGLKFQAEGFVNPVLYGELLVDLGVLRSFAEDQRPPEVRPDVCDWDQVWLLLAFCLRDWMEGDIRLGFGASKGYGNCRAELQGYSSAKELYQTIVSEVKQ